MKDVDLDVFEVGGTVTTGVRVYCMACESWFAEWTSREAFPLVSAVVDACREHTLGCEHYVAEHAEQRRVSG